jgi:hypothetical protein
VGAASLLETGAFTPLCEQFEGSDQRLQLAGSFRNEIAVAREIAITSSSPAFKLG